MHLLGRFQWGCILNRRFLLQLPGIRTASNINLTMMTPLPDERQEERTVVAGNGVVVCWHPAKSFPYEHSKPIVREEAVLKEGDSALKVQLRNEYRLRHAPPGGPKQFELQDMLYTSKHIWGYKHTPKPRAIRVDSKLPKEPTSRRGL